MLNVIGQAKYRVVAVCVVASQPYPIGETIESQLTDEISGLIALGALEPLPAPNLPLAENKAVKGPKENKLTNG